MNKLNNQIALPGTERPKVRQSKLITPAPTQEQLTATLIVRRRPGSEAPSAQKRVSHAEFADAHGAAQEDIDRVATFAHANHLEIVETNRARRTVIVRGSVEQMNAAFSVRLNQYSSPRGAYRGHEGPVHVPADLAGIVEAVVGLDTRKVPARHANSDPGNTNPLTPQQVAQLYNFPPGDGTGQTIGIYEMQTQDGFGDTINPGYNAADLTATMNAFGGGLTVPVPVDVPVDGQMNSGTSDNETLLDISVAGAVAQNARIAVYFTGGTNADIIHALQMAFHPTGSQPVLNVFSISYGWSPDDTTEFISDSDYTQMSNLFLDAVALGITVLISSGDSGAFYFTSGVAEASYPASDPSVLACGGTTIGNINGSNFDEYVWNDTFGLNSGATGGGVSARFSLPSYQAGAGVPARLDNDFAGRGIPDVAGNASPNSGYAQFIGGVSQGPIGGTSAVAPLYAALIARVNQNLNRNVGFVNAALYALNGGVSRDVTGAAGPANNSFNGVTGYPAAAGWDACTGWGSIDGVKFLNGITASIFEQDLEFWVDKSTFGHDEVSDTINSASNGWYRNAFWLVLNGFTPNQVGSAMPSISGPFSILTGVITQPNAAGPEFEDAAHPYTPQRIRFPFDIQFQSSSLAGFPAADSAPLQELAAGLIVINGKTLIAETAFEFIGAEDPYFNNIDPTQNNVFYLSEDLRLFTACPGLNETPVSGVGTPPSITTGRTSLDTAAGYGYIQNLLTYLNGAYSDPSGPDPFDTIFPEQGNAFTGDSSVTPFTPNPGGDPFVNYNFAVARVRMKGTPGAAADGVKVFFRMFTTQSNDTDYNAGTTYLSTLDAAGLPASPLAGPGGVTLPFFATGNYLGNADYTAPSVNNTTVTIGADGGVWQYFGCFINVYDPYNLVNGQSIQQYLAGTHHCMVAQIAYDDAPIVNTGGTTVSPENSDKLAQRNLQVTPAAAAGSGTAHAAVQRSSPAALATNGNGSASVQIVPQTFDLRLSRPLVNEPELLLNYPDELMIDWGNIPEGSIARIYWPQTNSADILQLASQIYSTHRLSASDAHTIQCSTVQGVTYVPIPPGAGENLAGLFTIELTGGLRLRQEFNVVVRRISTRQLDQANAPKLRADATSGKGETVRRNWRYVVGTFQVRVPVENKQTLLEPTENTLAIMKARVQRMPATDRWRPVLLRYISALSGTLKSAGGDPASIPPSLNGYLPVRKPGDYVEHHTGKVASVIYDRFGDFEGFLLVTEEGAELTFRSKESAIEAVIRFAWEDRVVITVETDPSRPHNPTAILLRRAPHKELALI